MTDETISPDMPYPSKQVDVLGSRMHYVEEGTGDLGPRRVGPGRDETSCDGGRGSPVLVRHPVPELLLAGEQLGECPRLLGRLRRLRRQRSEEAHREMVRVRQEMDRLAHAVLRAVARGWAAR